MGNSSKHPCHYVTSVNIKKFSRLVDYIAREDPAGGASFSRLLTAAGIIQLFILMADCNPKRVCVYETQVTKIRLYSSFKCTSDYR